MPSSDQHESVNDGNSPYESFPSDLQIPNSVLNRHFRASWRLFLAALSGGDSVESASMSTTERWYKISNDTSKFCGVYRADRDKYLVFGLQMGLDYSYSQPSQDEAFGGATDDEYNEIQSLIQQDQAQLHEALIHQQEALIQQDQAHAFVYPPRPEVELDFHGYAPWE
ncbi:hypothetical protein Bca52824_096391 [Brassica carinata]|uniref:Uncharacterized protein n=1 Tax=Brassica carinata TaxID=52824 RepID=A0A8X7P1N9_BRACI|nr:hypothetical protein Bca52824_096391 [Brassica carinata]